MNKGKYVFSQVMIYFPRWVFEAAVEKYNGDFHAKNLNMQVDDGQAALGGEQEPAAAVTDVLLGKEGEGDGQRGQEGEKKAFHSYGFSPKGMKNGK